MKRILKTLGLVVLFLLSTNSYAQTKKEGKWFAQFEAGYGSVIRTKNSDQITAYDLEYGEGDSIISMNPYDYYPNGGNGLFLKTDFRFIKESGWHKILGIIYFNSFPSEYTLLRHSQNSSLSDYLPLGGFINTEIKKGYLSSRFGLGYETTYKKRMNFYIDGYLLIGTGWRKETENQKGLYYDINTNTYPLADVTTIFSSKIFQGYGIGFSIETGGVIPINQNLDFAINLSVSTYLYGYIKLKYNETWVVDEVVVLEGETKMTGKEFNQQILSRNTNGISDVYSNIGFSVGLRYKLSK